MVLSALVWVWAVSALAREPSPVHLQCEPLGSAALGFSLEGGLSSGDSPSLRVASFSLARGAPRKPLPAQIEQSVDGPALTIEWERIHLTLLLEQNRDAHRAPSRATFVDEAGHRHAALARCRSRSACEYVATQIERARAGAVIARRDLVRGQDGLTADLRLRLAELSRRLQSQGPEEAAATLAEINVAADELQSFEALAGGRRRDLERERVRQDKLLEGLQASERELGCGGLASL